MICIIRKYSSLSCGNLRDGVYWKLKDASLPWTIRLKIWRYAWKEISVHIANKQQVLLDWIIVALSGKQCVPREDACAFWECLDEVFHTKLVHTMSSDGTWLIVKPALFQLVLTELKEASTRTSISRNDSFVASCCYSLITSDNPNFSQYFLMTAGNIIQLVVSCVKRTCTDISCGRLSDICWRTLFEACLKKYTPRAPAQQVLQQVTDLLLPWAINFFLMLEIGVENIPSHDDIPLQRLEKGLMNLLSMSFFSMEILQYFRAFLNVKVGGVAIKGVHTTEKLPKFIESLFITISAQGVMKMCAYLPHFYEGFIAYYGAEMHTINFCLLRHLTWMIETADLTGQSAKYASPKILGCGALPDAALPGLCALLCRAAASEVFDPAAEAAPEQLAWMQQMASRLLLMEQRCSSWTHSLQALLALSHLSLEPQLTTIIAEACLKPATQLHEAAQSEFMCDLVDVYTRLRQPGSLMNFVIDAFSSSNANNFAWTSAFGASAFVKCLASMLPDLPSATCLAIWSRLNQAVISKWSGESSSVFCTLCDLLVLFMQHMKVVDYSITLYTKLTARQRLTELATALLSPALRNASLANIAFVLRLAWAWGELSLHLRLYAWDAMILEDGPTVSNRLETYPDDISALHYYLSGAEWYALSKRINGGVIDYMGNSSMLSYLWQTLLMQKLQATLLFPSTENNTASLVELTSIICSNIILTDTCWDGSYHTVSDSNASIARLHTVCEYFASLTPFMSPALLDEIATIILQSYLQPPGDISENSVTVKSLSKQLLRSSYLGECDAVQTAVITVAWRQVAKIFGPMTEEPRKKKAKDSAYVFAASIALLSSTDISWKHKCYNVKDDAWTTLLLVGQSIDVESTKMITTPAEEAKVAQQCASFLRRLPLESLLPANCLRCILGSILVIKISEASENALRNSFLKLLEILLENAKSVLVLSLIDSGLVCREMLEYARSHESIELIQRVFASFVSLATKQHESLQSLNVLTVHLSSALESIQVLDETVIDRNCTMIQASITTYKCLMHVAKKLAIADIVKHACFTQAFQLQKSITYVHQQLLRVPGQIATQLLQLSLYAFAMIVDNCHLAKDDDQTAIQGMLVASCEACLKIISMETPLCFGAVTLVSNISRKYGNVYTILPINFMPHIARALLERVIRNCVSDFRCIPIPSATFETLAHGSYADDPIGERKDVDKSAHDGEACMKHGGVDIDLISSFVNVLSTFTPAALQSVLVMLVDIVNVQNTDINSVYTVVTIWSVLLTADMDTELLRVLKVTSHTLLMKLLAVVELLQIRLSKLDLRLYVAINQCAMKMLSFGSTFLTRQCIPLVINVCQYTPVTNISVDDFVAMFYSVYNVLNEALMQHSDMVCEVIPPFVAIVRHILVALIDQSDHSISTKSESETKGLVGCAHLFDRLVSLLLTHKVHYARAAPYLIADYVNEVSKVTLLPDVKDSLLASMCNLLSICDHHSVALLQTNLSCGVKDIFQSLHTEYKNYFKYTGKV